MHLDMRAQRLYALRGATQTRNEVQDMITQVTSLYDALLAANALAEEDIVSLVFSVTADLTAINPAAALRRGGRAADLALFAVAEPQADGALDHVVRILLHCYLGPKRSPQHVYRNGAEVLRPDRSPIHPLPA